MTGTKTVAERLREITYDHVDCPADVATLAIGSGAIDCAKPCPDCTRKYLDKLADAIEAEHAQAVSKALIEEVVKQENTDSVLLYNAAKDLKENADTIKKSVLEDIAHCAGLIRKAIKGAKPQLPEGVIWPTYEDNELVKPFDKLPGFDSGGVQKFIWTSSHNGAWQLQDAEGHMLNVMYGEHVKHPEPEVLDANRVPIHVGDTVWNINNGKRYEVLKLPHKGSYQSVMVRGEDGTDGFDPDRLTHRKPDTQEDIDNDLKEAFRVAGEKVGDTIWFDDIETLLDRVESILERQRKLLGGE